jgi:hypothetical protein
VILPAARSGPAAPRWARLIVDRSPRSFLHALGRRSDGRGVDAALDECLRPGNFVRVIGNVDDPIVGPRPRRHRYVP